MHNHTPNGRKALVTALLILGLLAGWKLADAQVKTKGVLYKGTVAGSGSVTTSIFETDGSADGVTVYVNATRGASFIVSRVDPYGTTHAQSTSQTVVAGTEKIQTFTYPLHRFVVAVTNTSTNTNTVQVEVDDGRPRR